MTVWIVLAGIAALLAYMKLAVVLGWDDPFRAFVGMPIVGFIFYLTGLAVWRVIEWAL